MTPGLRKLALTAHVTLGRLARRGHGFLALAVAGLTSQGAQMVFHSAHAAHAARALVMLSCGPVTLTLPGQSRT